MSPSPVRSPRGCTNFKTRHFARLLTRHYDAALAEAGLRVTQYALLGHVRHLGPIAPGELARQMGLDASTLTRNLQPLLAAGWLQQSAGRDARARSIVLTDAGAAKHSEAQRHWKQAQLRINALLGAERVAALHALIDDCASALEAESAL